MSNTGVYIYRNGKCIKVSDKAHVPDTLQKRHMINGYKDKFNAYRSLEDKGELRKVKDNWQGFLKNYKSGTYDNT